MDPKYQGRSLPGRRRITEFLDKDEIRYFSRRSDWRGAWAVASVWALIAACFAGMAFAVTQAWYVAVPLFVVSFATLGGRHLALAILMHEAAHGTLFKSQWGNRVLTDWLAARLIWNSIEKFRAHHLVHHANTTAEFDPDLPLYSALPVSRGSMVRKYLRDLVGLTGIKFLIGRSLMSAGYLKWSDAIGEPNPAAKSFRWWQYPVNFITDAWGTVLTNALLYGLLAATGHGWLYAMWILAYMIPFSMYVRTRSLAEHAGLEIVPDTLKNTRTTYANILWRSTVAPLRVNYHLEHHIAASTPYYRLPELHRHLLSKQSVPKGWSYSEVLKVCTTVAA